MDTLYIDQTERTPKIRFCDGNLLIWGTFVPVDPAVFYLLLHEWVIKYSNSPAPVTVVDIGLKYTRGYTMNYIKKLLQELIIIKNNQRTLIINWHYIPNGLDVRAGEYLSRKINCPFNFVEVEII